MKQVLVTIALLLSCYLSVSAQKEVYFNSKPTDSISIKSIQGVFVGAGLINAHIGFMREQKINNTNSFILSGNASETAYIYKTIYGKQDSITGRRDQKNLYKYGLHLSVCAQPRWYFDYIKRYQRGADCRLNSGWFLGLPLEITTSQLDNQTPFDLNISANVIIGYRQALSKKLFAELVTGMGIQKTLFHYTYLRPSLYVQLNACYTL